MMDRFLVKLAPNAEGKGDLLAHIVAKDRQNDGGERRKGIKSVDPPMSISNPRSSSGARKSPTVVVKNVLPVSSSSSSKCVASEWSAREQSQLSDVQVACQQRLASLKAKNFTGWKTDQEGHKIYTTFRSGERVVAEGQEGFRLACGDEQSKKKRKRDHQDAAAHGPT